MSNVINLNKTIKDGSVQGPKRPVSDRTTAASPRRWRALATELYANGFTVASLEASEEHRDTMQGSILECLEEPDRTIFKAFLLPPISKLVDRSEIGGRPPFEGKVFGRQEVLMRRRGVAKYVDQYQRQVLRNLQSIEIIQQACLGSILRMRLLEQRHERIIPKPVVSGVPVPSAGLQQEHTLAEALASALSAMAPLRREILERTYEIGRARTLEGRNRHTGAHIAREMNLDAKVVSGHYQVSMKLLRSSSRNAPLLPYVHVINPGFVNTAEEALLCDIFNVV